MVGNMSARSNQNPNNLRVPDTQSHERMNNSRMKTNNSAMNMSVGTLGAGLEEMAKLRMSLNRS